MALGMNRGAAEYFITRIWLVRWLRHHRHSRKGVQIAIPHVAFAICSDLLLTGVSHSQDNNSSYQTVLQS